MLEYGGSNWSTIQLQVCNYIVFSLTDRLPLTLGSSPYVVTKGYASFGSSKRAVSAAALPLSYGSQRCRHQLFTGCIVLNTGQMVRSAVG